MKTPGPERAAGRKKLAAAGQALGDGSFPIPNVDYLKRAIRSVGRAPASKRPALKALIRKRATELKATNAPGVKGTWPFTASNDTAALELVGPGGYEHGWIKVGGYTSTHKERDNANKALMAARVAGRPSSLTGKRTHTELLARNVADHPKMARDKTLGQHVAGMRAALDAGDMRGFEAHRSAAEARVREHAMMPAGGIKDRGHGDMGAPPMANDTEALEMATATAKRLPMVRGAADIQLSRSGPGTITAMHKSSGRKIGTITPKGRGYAGTHADGKATGASGGQQGALAGLIAYHNGLARNPAESAASLANGARAALNLAGSLPVSTPAASSSDGPRVTSMGGSGTGKTAAPAGSPSGLSPYALAIYKKFIARKMKPAVALAFAKRADAMHMKAAKSA